MVLMPPPVRRAPAIILAMTVSAAISPLWGTMHPADFVQNVTLYRYRPAVFADQKIQQGLGVSVGALQGMLWYMRMDEATRTRVGMQDIAETVQSYGIPGLDFSGHKTLTDADLERLFQMDLWISGRGAGPYYFRLLKLPGTLVTDRGTATLGRLMDLQVLELNDRITDEGVGRLSRLQGLRVLGLPSPAVTDRSLDVLAQLVRLERLVLRNTQISDKGLARIGKLPLHHIELGPRMTDEGVRSLSAIKTIEMIDASQARVTQRGLERLLACPRLHTLFLGASLTDADMLTLASLKGLIRLDLTGAAITDQGARALSELSALEELALSGSRVTEKTLGILSRLPKLRYLELSDTGVAVESFARSAGGFQSLEVLSFSTPRRLTATDLRPLARFPNLHAIVINGMPLGRELLKVLRSSSGVRRKIFDWLVPEAEAATSEAQLEEAIELASADQPAVRRPFAGLSGLHRIHEAESSLDEVIPAVSKPTADTFEATEKNFLGEIEVGVIAPKRKME